MLQQISVFVSNQVGAVLAVTRALKEEAYNIRAFSVYDTPEFSILRLVFDPSVSTAAALYLEHQGFFIAASDVVGVVLEDKPGDLNRILEVCNEKEILVNYMYSLMLREKDKPVMIMHTDQDERLETVLRHRDYQLI